MKILVSYFGGGSIIKHHEAIYFRVTKFKDIYEKIIPLFKKYSIIGVKALDFEDWCKAAEIMKAKGNTKGRIRKNNKNQNGYEQRKKWEKLKGFSSSPKD